MKPDQARPAPASTLLDPACPVCPGGPRHGRPASLLRAGGLHPCVVCGLELDGDDRRQVCDECEAVL